MKENEVEMKLEIEDNHEKAQENELNRSWMQEAINLPGIFEIGLIRSNTNDDSDDTLPWSPRIETLSMPESGAASGNDSEETLPWTPRVKTLERIPRVESRMVSNKFHSLDDISQDESESEDVPPVNFPLKEAFVAMRSALKAVRKKKRKRKIKHKLIKADKWHVNSNSEDKEWTPIWTKNPSTKIVLVKNRVHSSSSEHSGDEQSQSESQSKLWKQNNLRWFPSTDWRHKQNQTPQKKQERMNDQQIRKLLLTDEQSQASLLQFYKSNWERKKLKEQSEEKSELSLVKKTAVEGENRPQYISVVSHRDTELGRILDDKVMLSDFPTGDQLGSRLEYEDSRRRSLQGRRPRSARNNSVNPVTNEPATSDVEGQEQNEQGEEEGDMERGHQSREVFSKASVPVFPLERILEKQEGETDEDGKNERDERGAAGAVTVPVRPELQEGSLSEGQPGGEGGEPSCPLAHQLPGWLRGPAQGPAPRCKSQDSGQVEMGPMDKETTLWQRNSSLR